jgi:hypothetical protein
MDFLTTEPVVDFLGEQISAYEDDWKCVECGHALTVHTAGFIVHGRCLLQGCDCKRAVLTESAVRKMKNGIMP